MKIKEIFNSILTEIGDTATPAPSARFVVGEYKGSVEFPFLDDQYNIDIRLPIKTDEYMTMAIDFDVDGNDEYAMTNKNNALKVMSFVVGGVEEWIRRYNKKFGKLPIVYIKYNPKAENSETSAESGINARDRIYRMYIEKFANRHGSSTTFYNQGGIVAKFEPRLTIK